MNIIVCVDDNFGMCFNNRRQSRDKAVYEDILALVEDNKLFVNEYSLSLFSQDIDNLYVNNKFLSVAESNDYCFIENVDPPQKCDKIILYRWNRVYPYDRILNKELFSNKRLIESIDFLGNSHQKITREIYE